MKYTEVPGALPAPVVLAADIPAGNTSLLFTIGALAGILGSAIGTAATAGLAILPILRQRFPDRMSKTQLDDYAEELFQLIAHVNPMLMQLSPASKEQAKAELKDPALARDLILSSPEEAVKQLGKSP
ncbi:MAG TPA: hypothetical protein V6D03_00065 [Candidatus Caenarcaniphilales bacterium]|jgi:hypothetical protein